MDDKDRVFARFKDDKPEASNRRELLTIPRRAGAPGSRTVEVVHVRSGGAIKDRPRRVDPYVRAASWEGGFPAKQTVAAPALVEPETIEVERPTAHLMPAWEAATPEAKTTPSAPDQGPVVAARRARGRPRKLTASTLTRHVADPFDASDDGTNCMRCGYAIEPAREKRGLMTCADCG